MPPQMSDSDTGIRVSVTPAQSAFFAGENFTATVTFTNTRSSDSPVRRVLSHAHKRAAHSISSAPLARPPTSPITPRTAVPPLMSSMRAAGRHKSMYERKGLIGLDAVGDEKVGESRPTKGKSMSVTLSSQDVVEFLPSSAGSPLRNLSVPANHPHARKQSIMDGQTQAQIQLKELSSSPALVDSGSASTSAFSLSLDTISENASSALQSTEVHSYPPRRHPINLGLGLGPPPVPFLDQQPPPTALPSTFAQPDTELVLYAYAQLTGVLTLSATQEESRAQAQTLNAVRYALQRRQAVGGGRMDISSSLDARAGSSTVSAAQRLRRGHARSASLSTSLMALLSPPAPVPQPWTPGHKARSPSLLASLLSTSVSSPAAISSGSADAGSGIGLGLSLDAAEEVPADTPLPVFDVQPSMLAVDLVLAPGESRSYTYTLPLPANLPPTYRGRALKFAYHLVVGVCRSASPSSSPNTRGSKSSTSQVMRVPLRIYNHVDVSGVQRPYDLLWPVLHPPSKEQTAKVVETAGGTGLGKKAVLARRISQPSQPQSPSPCADPVVDLRDYAMRLLATFPDPSGNDARLPATFEAMSLKAESEQDLQGHGGGELTGCREAVEILTRNMRKVSYDVNKDGIKVAVLTFTKSAYRLGETVVGVVELNERSSRARVLKLSIMLEAHETLPSSLTPFPSPASKKLRKLHAESHAALTLSTLRTSFALDIPSDATPAFQCACASPNPHTGAGAASPGTPGGLAWMVRLCLLVGVASPHARTGAMGLRVKHLMRDGPQGEWGTAWHATRGIAPLQNIDMRAVRRAQADAGTGAATQRGWASYFLSGLLAPGEREYHDGDEEDDDDDDDDGGVRDGVAFDETRTIRGPHDPGVDLGGGDDGWSELRVETVECEVPIRVWPGNTAFRPLEVVFDV